MYILINTLKNSSHQRGNSKQYLVVSKKLLTYLLQQLVRLLLSKSASINAIWLNTVEGFKNVWVFSHKLPKSSTL